MNDASTTMINWKKMGRIFVPSGQGFFKTHATRPIPYRLNDQTLRLFFSSRDHDDRMLPTFIDVDVRDPSRVVGVSEEALVGLGEPGTFDDSGVTVGSIVEDAGGTRVYYTGWKRRRSLVSFELSIGVLRWNRDSDALTRVFAGPILGQDKDHPFQVAGPFVIVENGVYRMWYCSGDPWRFPQNNPEPIYTVHYAQSSDGIDWIPRKGRLIDYKYDGEVVSAPWVLKVRRKYGMWYSMRGHVTKEAKNYRIGYAESDDGVSWTRRDELAGISVSASGWDSEMICYPSFYPFEERMYMFYSGNSVGKEGIGYAISENFLA